MSVPFGNAKMRSFRNSIGDTVWILEHEYLRSTSLSGDWRNFDLAKLADDFRRDLPELAARYSARPRRETVCSKPWLLRLKDALGV